MQTSPLPFRTYLLDYTPASNEEGKAQMEALRAALNPDSAKAALLAASHPSEMIRYTLVERWDRLRFPGREESGDVQKVRKLLVDSALEGAESRGEVWTPLIDVLVSSGVWNHAWADWERAGRPEPAFLPHESLAERMDAWLETADVAAIEPLLEFHASALLERVGRKVRTWDVDSIYHAMGKDAIIGVGLLENEHLSDDLRAELAMNAWDHIACASSHHRYGGSAKNDSPDRSREMNEVWGEIAEAGMPRQVVEEFLDGQERRSEPDRYGWMMAELLRDRTLTEKDLTRIWKLATGASLVRAIVDDRTPEDVRAELWERDPGAAQRVLSESHDASEAIMLEAYERAGHMAESTAEDVLRNPACPLSIARLMTVNARRRVAEALARTPRWREDPPIRSSLLASRHESALRILLDAATPEQFSEVFRAYVKVSQSAALQYLETMASYRGIRLKEADVLPLLQNPSSEVRLKVMTAFSRLASAEAPVQVAHPVRTQSATLA